MEHHEGGSKPPGKQPPPFDITLDYRHAPTKTALKLLKWVTMMGTGGGKPTRSYCRLLGTLLSRVQGGRFERSAERRLFRLLDSLDKESVAEVFKQFLNENNLIALAMLVQYHDQKGKVSDVLGLNGFPSKGDILDVYIKECLMTKVAKSVWYLNKTSKNIFPMVTEDNFKTLLLPAIQKAMLRSPEIAAEVLNIKCT